MRQQDQEERRRHNEVRLIAWIWQEVGTDGFERTRKLSARFESIGT